jgi:monofunctional biosynthetic peptidoglycan transglycosylase
LKRPRLRTLARIGGALAVLLGLWLAWELLTWPDVHELAATNPSTTAFIERYRREQVEQGKPGRVAQSWLSYEEISPNLKKAVLVAEDINFFSHDGFDSEEIREAVREALQERRAPRGASTITQQLSRNLWLSPSRNPLRKLREAALTYQLERALSKERILELYLNVAEFGPGIYGAEATSGRAVGRGASQPLDT